MRVALAVLLIALLAVAVGCGGGREETASSGEEGERSGGAPSTRSSEASEAARARGLPVEQENVEDEPIVTLEGIQYEWRLQPEKGLHVSLEFGNANEVFERARAYVFTVAYYSGREASSARVCPWNAELQDGRPVDYRDGNHILYRKDYSLTCFVPYEDREGYHDRLRIIVYSEEGDILIEQEHELEVTGEPTGRVRVKPTLAL